MTAQAYCVVSRAPRLKGLEFSTILAFHMTPQLRINIQGEGTITFTT